jgi:hypothetical protein
MKAKVSFTQSIVAGLYASATSIVINAVLFFVFKAAGVFTDDIFIQPNEPLTIVPVVMASFLPLMVGSVFFFLLDKFTSIGLEIFNIASIAFLLFSLSGPFTGIPGVTTGYAIVLDLMHLVVGGAVLYFINKTAKTVSA